MEEQEEKQNSTDSLPKQEILVTEHKPDESQSAEPKRVEENKPKQQKESDKQKILKDLINKSQRTDPKDIIRKCLYESFDGLNDILNFCFYNFESLYKEVKEIGEFSTIIRRVIEYCNKHGAMEILWERLKEADRGYHYNIYYPMWKQALTTFSDSIGRFIDTSQPSSRESATVLNYEDRNHPLSSDDIIAIIDWFQNELGAQERSMVLTVALFEGINRKHLISISNEIKQRLFDPT